MKKQKLTGTAPNEPQSSASTPTLALSSSPVLGAHDDVVQVVTVSPSTTCNIPKKKTNNESAYS